MTLELNISGAEYWIIRWSLASDSPEGETRWRMMTANYAGRSPASPSGFRCRKKGCSHYSSIAMALRMDTPKPVEWIASSRDDLREFPQEVRRVMGQAIDDAEHGDEHPSAKALKGFGGRGVLEIVDDFDGDTYRAVYTVKFAGVIYVLHAFQKKSKKGIATPQRDIDLIKARLKRAEEHYRENYVKGTKIWLTR